MKKILYIFPLIAMAFASCNNNEDLIFSESAADRLNSSRIEAQDKLTSNGGLWAMEYFANDEEQGYVMLFRFNDDGSVVVSANHKWIDNQFKQEKSLWTIGSDSGTVLSFNSYNSLFHVFSDPADITGPNQPMNPDTDRPIDETGYGHSGDYEFIVMRDNNQDAMRLLGKKTGYEIFMYRLPSDTNEQEYLENIRARERSIFSSYFPKLIITEKSTGERFVATSENGFMTVYPENGHSIAQAKTMNYITTRDGIRFMKPFEVYRAENGETTMEEFKFTEDGGLECEDFVFSLPIDNYEQLFFDRSLSWDMVIGDGSCNEFNTAFDAFKTSYDKYFRSRGSKLNGIRFEFDNQNNKDVLSLVKSGSAGEMTYTRNSEIDANGLLHLNISLTNTSNNGALVLKNVSGSQEFFNMLNSHSYKVTYRSALAPDVVTLTDVANPAFFFNMQLH